MLLPLSWCQLWRQYGGLGGYLGTSDSAGED